MGWEDEFLYNSKNGKLTFFCQKIVFLSILILKQKSIWVDSRFVKTYCVVWSQCWSFEERQGQLESVLQKYLLILTFTDFRMGCQKFDSENWLS